MFNPYRGAGKIRISFLEGEESSNAVAQGEIIPYNGGYILFISIAFIFLLFMALFAIVTDSGIYGKGILLFGWLALPTVLYLLPFWYRKKLREYRDSFLADLKANITKKKSFR